MPELNATEPVNENNIRELENEVITCILHNSSIFSDALQTLQFSDFLDKNCRIIFDVCTRIYNKNGIINVDTIKSFIDGHEELKRCFDNIDQILDDIWYHYSPNLDFAFLCNQVKVFSINRQIKEYFSTQIANSVLDINNFDTTTFKWTNDISNIIHSKKDEKILELKDIIAEYQKKMSAYDESTHHQTRGTPTGFIHIDKLTDGFQRGDLIILAARPGTGKTALALNIAINSARHFKNESIQNDNSLPETQKNPIIVIFSMEMGKEQLLERMAASITGFSISKIRRRDLTPQEKSRLNTILDDLQTLPIYINDSSNLSIMDIQADLHRLSLEYDIRLVIVDYLQLLKGQINSDYQVNRQQEVANISRLLKLAARENQTPVLALAQLSREIERRPKNEEGENPRPLLSDLRESGAIEQDADLVTFLYVKYNINPFKSDMNEENNQQKPSEIDQLSSFTNVQFIIAKHRNGPTGEVELSFAKDCGLFTETR